VERTPKAILKGETMGIGGVRDRCIRETPIAVVDCETTGLSPWDDRMVEL
jgi:DNA polymerase III epsilon subunit-like protein